MRAEGIESYVETIVLPVLRTRRAWRVQELVKLLESLRLPPKEVMEYLLEVGYVRVVGVLAYVEEKA
jgi:hypothetical protein